MQKNYFIAQESFRYSVRKRDWFFLLHVYIKTFRKKIGFCIWMKITTTRTFIYTKSKKNCQMFLYTKSRTLFKKLDNFRYVFIYKKPYTWRYGIFMKFLKLAFTYKKHDTLGYVTFFIQKARHFAKSKTICDTFYIQKSGTFALRDFLLNFWNFGGGGAFINKLKKYFAFYF